MLCAGPTCASVGEAKLQTGEGLEVGATVDGVSAARHLPQQGGDLATGIDLIRFTESLLAAASIRQLEQRYLAGFGRMFGAAMYSFDLINPDSGRFARSATANVSDAFLAAYHGGGRDVDPLLAHAYATGRPAYNLELMSSEEWLKSAVYRRALRLHSMRHLVEVPVRSAGRIVGNLDVARSDPAQDFSADEIRLLEAIARVLGLALEGMDSRERVAREHAEMLTALELAGAAIVVSDPGEPELRLNDAARRVLGDVIDAEERLHELLVRPLAGGGFSRRVAVELTTGAAGVVHAYANPVPHHGGGLVAVLELEREEPGIAPGALAVLTPREREVAGLVVDGLADREIAERIYLSRHTVAQHVKQIYRKLGVDSRVGLTRLVLSRGR
jgi:DNA-binding CsgD family transcriptional regulator/GAF domain-containing protein